MCTVSKVLEYGMDLPANQWNRRKWFVYEALIRQAEVFDSISDQPDCIDYEKTRWFRQMQESMNAPVD